MNQSDEDYCDQYIKEAIEIGAYAGERRSKLAVFILFIIFLLNPSSLNENSFAVHMIDVTTKRVFCSFRPLVEGTLSICTETN